MKALFVIIISDIIISVLIFNSCAKDQIENPEVVKGFFDSMHFIRQGGGQIDFTIHPSDNFDQADVIVTKFSYRDTIAQFKILTDDEIAPSFASLRQAMNNQIQINGDFQQSTLHTGTWSYIFMVDTSNEYEVTNINLRDSLHKFEKLIIDRLQQ